MVVVAMMHGELRDIGMGELAHAAPANPRVHFERALAVALLTGVGGRGVRRPRFCRVGRRPVFLSAWGRAILLCYLVEDFGRFALFAS